MENPVAVFDDFLRAHPEVFGAVGEDMDAYTARLSGSDDVDAILAAVFPMVQWGYGPDKRSFSDVLQETRAAFYANKQMVRLDEGRMSMCFHIWGLYVKHDRAMGPALGETAEQWVQRIKANPVWLKCVLQSTLVATLRSPVKQQ